VTANCTARHRYRRASEVGEILQVAGRSSAVAITALQQALQAAAALERGRRPRRHARTAGDAAAGLRALLCVARLHDAATPADIAGIAAWRT
jgi:hypothetical protein